MARSLAKVFLYCFQQQKTVDISFRLGWPCPPKISQQRRGAWRHFLPLQIFGADDKLNTKWRQNSAALLFAAALEYFLGGVNIFYACGQCYPSSLLFSCEMNGRD